MQNLKYALASDIITSLAVITASGTVSSDANYGLASLYDRNPAKPTKFETQGPIRLLYDFGSARRIDGFSLPNHNLDDDLQCVVALSSDGTTPTCMQTLTVGDANLDGHRSSPWVDFTTASGYSASGFRYLYLYVPTNSVNIKLGESPVLARLREFSQWVQFQGTKGVKRQYQEALETEYGSVRVHRRKIKQRVHRYVIKGSDADYAALQDLGDDVSGIALPFFVTVDSSIKTDGGLYVRLTKQTADLLTATEEWFDVNPFVFDVQEVSRSLPL